MSAKHPKNAGVQPTPTRKKSRVRGPTADRAFSNFEVYLLILRLLREHPRTESALSKLLGELERSENGGYEGRILETLQQMVTGGYLRIIQYEQMSEAFALTQDGLDLICTPPSA